MPTRRYLQVDVFAPRAGAGNPLAVVYDAQGMEEAALQAFAAWTNLSETVFFLPPSDGGADYAIRIFTPRMELPFAGHPSVGAAWAALDAGLVRERDGRLVQECAAGLLPVRIRRQGERLLPAVRSPAARPVDAPAPGWLAGDRVWGAARGALPPALWNNGPDWWLGELADEAAVRTPRPDQAAIAALPAAASWPCSRARTRATARTWWCGRSLRAWASPKTRPPAASTPASPPCFTATAACRVPAAAT